MTLPLFVYGSMRDEDVRAIVLGHTPPELRTEPAWLSGVATAVVPGESYPYLVLAEGARVPGELIFGLDESCLDRIRFFEGDEYAAVECVAERAGGGRVAAMYFGGEAIPPAPVVPWSLERWQAREKARFLAMTHEFMALWRHEKSASAEERWQGMLRRHPGNDGS